MKGKHQHHHRNHAPRTQTVEQTNEQATVKSVGKSGYRFNLKPMVQMSLLGAFFEMLKGK